MPIDPAWKLNCFARFQISFHSFVPQILPWLFPFCPIPAHCVEVFFLISPRVGSGVANVPMEAWRGLQNWRANGNEILDLVDVSSISQCIYIFHHFSNLGKTSYCSLVLAYCKERTAVVSFSLCFERCWRSFTNPTPKLCLWPPGQKSVRVLRGWCLCVCMVACSWVHGPEKTQTWWWVDDPCFSTDRWQKRRNAIFAGPARAGQSVSASGSCGMSLDSSCLDGGLLKKHSGLT